MRCRSPRDDGQLLLPCVQQRICLALRLRAYWQAAAQAEGYARVEDAIIGVYRETGSVSATARRLGFSRSALSQKLKALGEPTGGPGGPNNPWGRAGKPENRQ